MQDPVTGSSSAGSGFFQRGPIGKAYREALRLGFHQTQRPRVLMALLSPMVTWFPLLILSLIAGHAIGHSVVIPFLHDPSAYGRYLFALPLLLLSDHVINTLRSAQTGYFLETGMIGEESIPTYKTLLDQLVELHRSKRMKVILLIASYAIVIIFRTQIAYSAGDSSWENLKSRTSHSITPAGWWCILVSLPAMGFLFALSFWRALVWSWFLFKVSRLQLELTATHPDRSGGLGFLCWGQASFGLILAAVSAVLSGSFAAEVLYHHETFDGLKYHFVIFVALSLAILIAPLLVFSQKMSRVRFRALLDYGLLTWKHDRAFDRKWIANPERSAEELLGSRDVATLANIGDAYEQVSKMRVVPFDQQAFIIMVACAVVPMVPFVLTTLPLTEIMKKLAVFLV